MSVPVSADTKAILLLTAPLIVGRGSAPADLLSAGEYKRLAQHLHSLGATPADLTETGGREVVASCGMIVEADRLGRLLGRGLQLSQAIERWRTRAIWVVSRADANYPARLRAQLRGDSPPVLYGCGDRGLLESGGLAVVGSRKVDDALITYTQEIGRLAASAGRTVVSGGAKGIDQAAMRGALEAGGRVCGVLADSLEKQAMAREHRDMILEERLTLVSPYDPQAGFNVGHAMGRNKLIYALADAALVARSDVGKGGTWAGAIEQLGKAAHPPIYVRSTGEPAPGLDALRQKGALPWPNPADAEALGRVLDDQGRLERNQSDLLLPDAGGTQTGSEVIRDDLRAPEPAISDDDAASPADLVFIGVEQALRRLLVTPMKEAEVATALDVTPAQAKSWLKRLVEGGVLERKARPASYIVKDARLFG